MKWLPMTLFIALSPVVAAYSGTFLDDFNDGNLDGWEIWGIPPHLVPDLVRPESGHLVLDTTLGRNEPPDVNVKFVSLELRTGNAEDWDSYTLTCRIRFV